MSAGEALFYMRSLWPGVKRRQPARAGRQERRFPKETEIALNCRKRNASICRFGRKELPGGWAMNITIAGRHMEITDALKAYVENGLQKLRSHFDKMIDANVVLEVEKLRHICEINLLANGVRIHGKESTPDMYASVDAVLAKLEKQIKKYKEKINRHQPRNVRDARNYHHDIISLSPENGRSLEHTASTDTLGHKLVNREQVAMKPMSVDEAVMQLDLVDDPFLVFSNADTSRLNVLYARDDGTYGLIEPQF
jgi:putative sigma-54 modulation protein